MVVGSSRPICAQTRVLLSTATDLFPLTPWKAEENFGPKYTKDKMQSVDADDPGKMQSVDADNPGLPH